MTWAIGPRVIRGQLKSDGMFNTTGWCELQGLEKPVNFELLGDPGPDFRGRTVYFIADPNAVFPEDIEDVDLSRLHPSQSGAAGIMTADRWTQTLPCSAREYARRTKAGEDVPTEWRRLLILEWFGQNGRVLIELVNPTVEFCPIREGCFSWDAEIEAGDWEELPMSSPRPEHCGDIGGGAGAPGAQSSIFDPVKDQDLFGRHPTRWTKEEDDAVESGNSSDDDTPDSHEFPPDPGLSAPETLWRQKGWFEKLWDNSFGEPLWTFFDHPERLPDPDTLDDDQLELQLKRLIAELALINIEIIACEHMTPRKLYAWLIDALEEVCQYSEIIGTWQLDIIFTFRFCLECEEESRAPITDPQLIKDLERFRRIVYRDRQEGADDSPS